MAFYLKKMRHDELVGAMEQAAKTETGIAFSFSFEFSSDGHTDLYIVKPTSFTREETENLVHRGWFDPSILEDLAGHTGLDLFSADDYLSQSDRLFQFILEITFGARANVAGVEELEDCVLLNIAIPT